MRFVTIDNTDRNYFWISLLQNYKQISFNKGVKLVDFKFENWRWTQCFVH